MQDALEVLLGVDVGAGGDERAAGQRLLKVGVLPAVQLVNWQLPHGVGPRRAVLRAGGASGMSQACYFVFAHC